MAHASHHSPKKLHPRLTKPSQNLSPLALSAPLLSPLLPLQSLVPTPSWPGPATTPTASPILISTKLVQCAREPTFTRADTHTNYDTHIRMNEFVNGTKLFLKLYNFFKKIIKQFKKIHEHIF